MSKPNAKITSYQRNGSPPAAGLVSLQEVENEADEVEVEGSSSSLDLESDARLYNWRLFVPAQKSITNFVRWLIVGGASKAQLSEPSVLGKCG